MLHCASQMLRSLSPTVHLRGMQEMNVLQYLSTLVYGIVFYHNLSIPNCQVLRDNLLTCINYAVTYFIQTLIAVLMHVLFAGFLLNIGL